MIRADLAKKTLKRWYRTLRSSRLMMTSKRQRLNPRMHLKAMPIRLKALLMMRN
jgi:hypothetical protein